MTRALALALLAAACSDDPQPHADNLADGAGPCEVRIGYHPSQGGMHVTPGMPITWSSNPPSSGQHFGTWVKWAKAYTIPIQRGYYVHNEEHGGVVLLYHCDFLYGQLGGDYVRRMTGHAPRAWYALSAGEGPHEITRIDDDTIELTMPDHSRFFRSQLQPMHDGERVETRAYAVTVLQTVDGHPRRVRIDFARPIDPARDVFVSLVDGGGRFVTF